MVCSVQAMMNKIASKLAQSANAPATRASKSVVLEGMLEPDANNFGLVRIAMALAVLVSHGVYLYTGTTSAEPLVAWTGFSLGEHAVQVFFFLSGILVAQSFARSGSLLDFTAARGLRIFPGLIVCVLLTAILMGPVMSSLPVASYLAAPETLMYFIKTVSLSTGSATLPGVFSAAPAPSLVNMSLWTLKYEVLCYAGLALAGCAGLFKPSFRPYSVTALAAFTALAFINPPADATTFTTLDNIRYFAVFFAMGTLAYLVRAHLPVHGAVLAVLFGLFVAAIGTRFAVLGAAGFLGYATLYVAQLPSGRLRALANRYDISFGVYIYACPIQQMLIETFPQAGAWTLIVAAVIVTVPVAMASWLLIERPALQARKPLTAAVRAFAASIVPSALQLGGTQVRR